MEISGDTWSRLHDLAVEAMECAYVPYSGYPVGAAAIADDGRLTFWVDVAMHHNRAVTGGQSGSDES